LSILRVFSLAWLLLPIIFFSFSGSKLPGYVLPACPRSRCLSLTIHCGPTSEIAACDRVRYGSVDTDRIELLRRRLRDVSLLKTCSRLQMRVVMRNAPVIAQRGDDRSAEFYAYGRVYIVLMVNR
jgi:hypothetical protein